MNIIKLPPATIRELPNGWLRKETGQTYKPAFGAERARVFAGRQALLNQLDRHILDVSAKRGGSSALGHR